EGARGLPMRENVDEIFRAVCDTLRNCAGVDSASNRMVRPHGFLLTVNPTRTTARLHVKITLSIKCGRGTRRRSVTTQGAHAAGALLPTPTVKRFPRSSGQTTRLSGWCARTWAEGGPGATKVG